MLCIKETHRRILHGYFQMKEISSQLSKEHYVQ